MRKLEEDNHALRAQISLIKGEATSRENTIKLEIQQLRDEIGHLKKPLGTDTNTSITTHDGNARRTPRNTTHLLSGRTEVLHYDEQISTEGPAIVQEQVTTHPGSHPVSHPDSKPGHATRPTTGHAPGLALGHAHRLTPGHDWNITVISQPASQMSSL